MIQFISKWVLILFYLFGGINHFWHPEFYIPLIPDYFPDKEFINIVSGITEIVLALGVVFKITRKLAAIGIIVLLIAFIPAHWYFIQLGGCIGDGLCAPVWVGWVRLILIHPLLMWWAWSVGKAR